VLHSAAGSDTSGPYSPLRLAEDLTELGIEEGDVLIAHVSISSVGWIIGAGVGLLAAVRLALGATGTLVVPTFTTYLNDPSTWVNRPVPPRWWPAVRDSLPPFDPALHSAQPGLGRFPELVRTAPDAHRSSHPLYSFASVGAGAADLLRTHPLSFGMGVHSPLAEVAAVPGKVLLLGVGWDRCSMLHLCEHRTSFPGRLRHTVSVPVGTVDGRTRWQDTQQLVMYEGDFGAIGRAARDSGSVNHGRVGAAPAQLCPTDALVTLGCDWMATHRDLRRSILPSYLREPTEH
jgi:aminoglycoside 3-N-acetyltransferase